MSRAALASLTPVATDAEPPFLKVAPALFVALWSTGFIAAKYGAPVAGPFSLLAVRFLFVIPILAAAATVLKRRWPDPRTALHAMVAGGLIHGLYLGGIFWAVKHGLPAGFAGLVVGLQPVLTAFFARWILGERVTAGHVLGLALGLIGVGLVLSPKLTGFDSLSPAVIAVALGAVAAISLGTVYAKRFASGSDLVTGTALQFVGASFVGIPMAAAEGFSYVPSVQLVLVVAWLVLMLSIGAVMLLLAMMRHGAASKVATLFYLVPPTTLGFAYLLFGETLGAVQLVGTALVVAAVLVATRKPRQA